MKTRLLMAALLAAAAPTPVALSGGPANYNAAIRMNHTLSGDFVDEYFFAFSGLASVSGQISAIFQPAQRAIHQIVFTDVELDGVDFTLGSRAGVGTSTNFARLAPTIDEGGFVLRVAGCAGACDGVQPRGSPITASYSGTLNVQRVPEPVSLALVMGALGTAGLAARRRRVTTATAPAPAASRGRRP